MMEDTADVSLINMDQLKEISDIKRTNPINSINVNIEKYEQVIIYRNYFHYEVILTTMLIIILYLIYKNKFQINYKQKKYKKKKQQRRVRSESTSLEFEQNNQKQIKNQISEQSTKDSNNIENSNLKQLQNQPLKTFSNGENQLVAHTSSENQSCNQSDDQIGVNTKKLFEDKISLGLTKPINKNTKLRFFLEEKDGCLQKTECTQIITTYQIDQKSKQKYQKYMNKVVSLSGTQDGEIQIIERAQMEDCNPFNPIQQCIENKKPQKMLALEYNQQQIKRKNSHVQIDSFETGRFDRIFDCEGMLGKGGFGEVYKARHKIENNVNFLNQTYAIKKIFFPIGKMDQINEHKFLKEVRILQLLNHKNIIRYNTFWIEQPEEEFLEKFKTAIEERFKSKDDSCAVYRSQKKTRSLLCDQSTSQKNNSDLEFDTSFLEENFMDSQDSVIQNIMPLFKNKTEIPLILFLQVKILNKMQFCNEKTLKEYLLERQEINVKKSFHFFTQILEGIQYIHNQGIVHRDLKPANLFIQKGNIVIGDFGLSTEKNFNPDVHESFISGQKSMTQNLGTPMYSAPEQQSLTHYNNKVDIYSLGLILFELFHIMNTEHEKIKKMNQLRLQIYPSEIYQFPKQLSLIMQMTQPNPALRPSVNQVLISEDYLGWKQEISN